jgi:hypothetical protein
MGDMYQSSSLLVATKFGVAVAEGRLLNVENRVTTPDPGADGEKDFLEDAVLGVVNGNFTDRTSTDEGAYPADDEASEGR